MPLPLLTNCPATLTERHSSYSTTGLRRVFGGRKVHHVLPYEAPASNPEVDELYLENHKRNSISGVQEKYSLILDKNKLRLIQQGERGTHILKPIPKVGKNPDQLPANEHLTMQIARQVFGIETAENALIFFQNGEPAFITRRFDVKPDGSKIAKEDFASLAGRTPHTDGEHYKYKGNYLLLFQLMKRFLPAYRLEIQKLFQLLLFNYLFSNGDGHLKNFSVLETPSGDFRLSPAYDLLNTRIHIDDTDFALEEGLLPKAINKGKVLEQFHLLAQYAELTPKQADETLAAMLAGSAMVERLTEASFLNQKTKRRYLQAYQTRYNKLLR